MTNMEKKESNGFAKKLSIMQSRLKSTGYDDNLVSFANMGGKYWKALLGYEKFSYLSTMMSITESNPDADPHLGDDKFQNNIIGSVNSYIELVRSLVSDYYLEVEKRDKNRDLAHRFPELLMEKIEKSTGSYQYVKLIQRDATYQVNPDVDKSRARRYTDLKLDTEALIKWTGKPKSLPVHPEAKAYIFKQLDMLWHGLDYISHLPDEQQSELIIEGLAPNTNSGYPFFTTQTKDNIVTLFFKWMDQMLPDLAPAYNHQLLTVKCIFDAVRACEARKIYEPSVNFTEHNSIKFDLCLEEWFFLKHLEL